MRHRLPKKLTAQHQLKRLEDVYWGQEDRIRKLEKYTSNITGALEVLVFIGLMALIACVTHAVWCK